MLSIDFIGVFNLAVCNWNYYTFIFVYYVTLTLYLLKELNK